jgi:hypothetical protein
VVPAVRTQSAKHPLKTVAPHRHQSPKDQVSDPQEKSLQVTDPARYLGDQEGSIFA